MVTKYRKTIYPIAIALIVIFIAVSCFYFVRSKFGASSKISSNVGDISSSDTTTYECTTPRIFNVKSWFKPSSIGRTELSGEHTVTTVSDTPYFNLSLVSPDLLASKLQELDFWNKDVLSTESSPRIYVRPQHLCVIATDIEQPYERNLIDETDVVYQSTSTIYDPVSDTLKLFVYLSPDFYKNEELDEVTLSYVFSYAVMKTIYSIQLPPPDPPVDFEKRYAGREAYLDIFAMRPGENSPLFRMSNVNWEE